MKKSELLAPAGTLKNLRYALQYGADAVYAGQPRYSLRVRNNDFDQLATLAKGIAETHAAGKQFYLTVNLLPHDAKIKTFLADLAPVVALKPDALIMADPGLILLAQEQWDIPIHLSVQANTMNSLAVRFWQQQGITRVILSRELGLEQIAFIRDQCPDMELEVFVHGALCVAFSGRCLLSGYFNHRDPNQGACTNACRWEYKVHLEETSRPGEYMPIEEDEHGTYIMNSKDLRAIHHVEQLMRLGIDSLKIEGRTKSYYYTARTTAAYRRAIDLAWEGSAFDPALLNELENLANRGYTEGFFRRHAPQDYQNYHQGSSCHTHQQYVGDVIDWRDGMVEIAVKNRFILGDVLTFLFPKQRLQTTVEMLMSPNGTTMNAAPGAGYVVRMPLQAPMGDATWGLVVKNL